MVRYLPEVFDSVARAQHPFTSVDGLDPRQQLAALTAVLTAALGAASGADGGGGLAIEIPH